jgi:hypothetical protein
VVPDSAPRSIPRMRFARCALRCADHSPGSRSFGERKDHGSRTLPAMMSDCRFATFPGGSKLGRSGTGRRIPEPTGPLSDTRRGTRPGGVSEGQGLQGSSPRPGGDAYRHRRGVRVGEDPAARVICEEALSGTTGATRRILPALSFSTGKDRSSGVSLPVAQTLVIAVRCHVRLCDLLGKCGRRLGRVDCGGSSPAGGGLLAMPGNVFAKRFACLFLWGFL